MASRPRKAKAKRPADAQPGQRVLGLDVSSVCVGWAIFDGDRLQFHGRYRQLAKTHGERLSNFREWLLALVRKYQPNVILYEKPYATRRRNTFGVLMMYCAIVRLVHAETLGGDVPDEQQIKPVTVKKALGVRKGKDHTMNKRLMLLRINELYGLSLKFKTNDKTKRISQDDEADAIALVHAWVALTGVAC